MPRFYFHTDDARDVDGAELPSAEAARIEAVKVLAEMVREDPGGFWRNQSFRLTLADDRGMTLAILELGAVLSPAVTPPRR